jgi:hypothetical protein
MIALLTALYSALNGDTQLSALSTSGVWQEQAAPKTAPPFTIFYMVPGSEPEHVFGGGEAFTGVMLAAKGVALNADVAEQIRERLQELLANADLTVTGFNVLSLLRSRDLTFHEEVAGATRYHRGDYYKAQLQKL